MELDKIYCEDCLETLSKMEDNSVDLIITSPPYNKGWWSYQTPSGRNISKKTKRTGYGEFNDRMEPEEYERWQREIIEECLRVLKPSGSFFYNHTELFHKHTCVFPTFVFDYPVKQLLIWDRRKSPNVGKDYFIPCNEFVFWLTKESGNKPYFNRKAGLFPKSIWSFQAERDNEHPAPFPTELPENCILTCSKEGDVVYDPFMGSGTVAKVARDLGRHYIGSELNPDYIIMAEERLGLI